jgi:ferrous iron transport protein A
MDASASPAGLSIDPLHVNLSTLAPGVMAKVVKVGSSTGMLTALERRLLELGFISGEHIEVLAETRPGRDPFVVRVGQTTLALRRREAQPVWVEMIRAPGASRQLT